MKNKTVYVLGAGFSAGVVNNDNVRVPSQENLVEQIIKHKSHFLNQYREFKDFLENVMEIPESFHNYIPLEDIFTPLDKCIAEDISFRNINAISAKHIRELIDFLIGKTLFIILREPVNKDYIDKFAKHLVKLSCVRANHQYSKNDPVSVISTNWDILLDNSIQKALDNFSNGSIETKGVVDYCCHISSYDPLENRIKPGLEILGKGGFIVKLLKLHGSLNWLQCPRCNRLYVDIQNKIAVSQYTEVEENKTKCKHCDENFNRNNSHNLVSNLIMPTFLKNLANTQYKLIWQNAAIELSEASKIVFIGYSLPAADYEMKQLLSRMVRNNSVIEVVDKGDNEADPKIVEIKKRYEVFFGRNVEVHHQGVEDYINHHLPII
jgi:hypothetical protein